LDVNRRASFFLPFCSACIFERVIQEKMMEDANMDKLLALSSLTVESHLRTRQTEKPGNRKTNLLAPEEISESGAGL
jgi:hypothetical protein